MIEFQQFFLIILISTLTVLVVIFSIFVFRILQELRVTLVKINKILDDTGSITESIAKPIAGLSDVAQGLKSGFKVFEIFGRLAGRRKPEAQAEESEDDD